MSTISKRTIYVGPAGEDNSKPLNVEGVALAAILPGTLLTQAATGLEANSKGHTVFGSELLIADKDQQRSKSVDTAWTTGENMVAIKARSGEFLNVLVATGQAITAKGIALSHNGSGVLKISATNGSEQVLAYADEIITTTSTELVRVRVA
jgi:hypothetical protein